MDQTLLRLLLTANPWLERPSAFPKMARHRIPDPFLPRQLLTSESWPVKNKAHLLVGARQVGKSSFLWHGFAQAGTAPLFLSAEEPYLRDWTETSPTLLLADLRSLLRPGQPVLIDEAQHLKEAGLVVKGLVDGGLENPLYVTGSSAFHLQSRTRESLAGRSVRAELHPLSLQELVGEEEDLPPLIRVEHVRDLARRQAIVGSYPEVWLTSKPDIVLFQILDAIVIRDASDRFHVEDTLAFRKLLSIIGQQVGNIVNVAEWAALCGVARSTVNSWIGILAESHLIEVVEPFVGGRRAELTHRPKIFFRDNGIRNAIVRQFAGWDDRLDRGPLFENWVASEIRKHLDPLNPASVLRYWRSKAGAEVDFVIEGTSGLVGVEFKATAMRRPELSRSARSFIEAYQPVSFFVINLSLRAEDRFENTQVKWSGPEVLATSEIPVAWSSSPRSWRPR
jgi:uncharacterized protein